MLSKTTSFFSIWTKMYFTYMKLKIHNFYGWQPCNFGKIALVYFVLIPSCTDRMGDILKPDVIWIEGRCYRVTDPTTEVTAFQEHDLYENDMTYGHEIDEGDEDDEFEIVMVDSSRYKTSLHVSKHYLGSIIGKKGSTKSRIERDTRTDIKIPRQGQEGDIVILGATAANVRAARRRINIIVMSCRMRQTSTHFISIPMNNADITKRFEEFKMAVLRDCAGSRGLEESIFNKAPKLHITMGVMSLMDDTERLHASKLLAEAKDKFIRPLLQGHLPLKIRLKGLSYMNDDPTQINVLYGIAQEEGGSKGIIQQLADEIVDHFYKAGFMEREQEHVKIHVTLINTKFRNITDASSEGTRNTRQPRETFDGSQVLKTFADYDFGVMELNDIHLSQRHSYGPDGYYQSTSIISVRN